LGAVVVGAGVVGAVVGAGVVGVAVDAGVVAACDVTAGVSFGPVLLDDPHAAAPRHSEAAKASGAMRRTTGLADIILTRPMVPPRSLL